MLVTQAILNVLGKVPVRSDTFMMHVSAVGWERCCVKDGREKDQW